MSPRCAARSVKIFDSSGKPAARAISESDLPADAVERGQYRHFMLKEIHEQPRAIAQTLEERIAGGKLLDAAFGPGAAEIFKRVKAVHIAACGTSYHAGFVASYLIEQICRIPARVEIASEYRYRDPGDYRGYAVRDPFAIGRNRRYAGRIAQCQAREVSIDAHHMQCGRELDGQGIEPRAADARRT